MLIWGSFRCFACCNGDVLVGVGFGHDMMILKCVCGSVMMRVVCVCVLSR